MIYDNLIEEIVEYVFDYEPKKRVLENDAWLCLLDAFGCAALALKYPACEAFLGPVVPGFSHNKGSRVFGRNDVLDPISAAFNMTCMIRWLDFNDTWLGSEWGHPSDCLGALLAAMDYANQFLNKQYTLIDLCSCLVKSYEVQGLLAQENAFNKVGIDHVVFLKIACTAVCSKILNLEKDKAKVALSNAIVDGHPLRTYRHFPNTCSRKSWAAAEAVSKALQLVFFTQKGMIGIPSALSAKKWGLYDVYFKGKFFLVPKPFSDFVVKNILFKVPFSAEYHSITAIECACELYRAVKGRIDEIDQIYIETQEAALRIISKKGPLKNAADRDHCLQYIVAVALIYGEVYPEYFEDEIANNPQIDRLRSKMQVVENQSFTKDYLDLNTRSCSNKITVRFKNGSQLPSVQVDFPLGHPKRRNESILKIKDKFIKNIDNTLKIQQFKLVLQKERFLNLSVDEWLNMVN